MFINFKKKDKILTNPRNPEGLEFSWVHSICDMCASKSECQDENNSCSHFLPLDSRYLSVLCGAAYTDENITSAQNALLLAFTSGFSAVPDKVFESIPEEICRWYRYGYYTPNRIVEDPDESSLASIKNLMNGTDISSSGKQGKNEDSGYALIAAFPAAFLAPSAADEISSMAAGILNASEDSQNGAAVLGKTVVLMLTGMNFQDALEKSSGRFLERIKNHKTSTNAFDVLGMTYDAVSAKNFEDAMNRPSSVKQVTGAIAGLEYGIKDIPLDNLRRINNLPFICSTCHGFEKHLANLELEARRKNANK